MTLKERKKTLSSIEMNEKFLLNQNDKLEILEETVNQPLNEEIAVTDPEMMHYFPRIKVSYYTKGVMLHSNSGVILLFRFTIFSWF